MLYLDPDRAKKILRHVLTSGVVYFPIFIQYHWIAGILQPGGHSESLRLTIFDSAPSDNVHAQLRRKLAAVWPSITIHIGRCARQRRYSEDCGIHMTANFFAHHLGVVIVGGNTVAARLRRYLYDTSLDPKPKATFLADVSRLLTQPQHTVSPVLGGVAPSGTTMTRSAPVRHTHRDSQQPGPKVQVSWTDIRPPQTPTGATQKTPSRLRHHTVGTETKARPDADTAPARKQVTPTAEPTVTKNEVPTMGNAVAPIQTSDIRKYANMRMAAAVHALVDDEEADEKAVRATLPKSTRKVHFADPVVFSPRKTGHSSPQRPTFATKRLPPHRIEGGDDRPAQGDAARPAIPPQAVPSEEAAFHSTVDYLWAATALANTGDGGTRALTARALVTQAGRLGFIRGIPYSLLEALKTLGKEPVPLPQPTTTGEPVQQPSDEMYYYRNADTNAGLPTRFGGAVFRLGAYWDTPRDQDLSQQGGVLFGRYRLTTSETQAELGVYVSDARVQNADGPRRQRLPVATRHHPTAPAGDYNTEVYRHYRQTGNATVLPTPANGRRQAGAQNAVRVRAPVQEQLPVADDTPPRQYDVPHHTLNDRGGLLPGGPACPRNWYIYPDKPPHISQLAWDAVTKGTRAVHRRWLYELRAMPVDLLGHRSLASAIIELIRRMAASRAWAWSTTSKAMASVSGALQQLPLYTNQNCPIILGHNVEWQKAAATAQRLEKERIAEPPAPITKDEKDAAQRNSLRFRDRQAALFLEMMWAFAARAGDLRTLQARDVRFTGGEPPPTVDNGVTVYPERYGVVLTMRRGKGARFRGPYSVPSTLPLEFAVILAHLLRERRPTQHLFAQPTETCNLVRTALRCENPLAALPSVRKGALRCMAANGMPIGQLMLMSGHRRADTLMRYLGYGHQLTTEAETAQANASDGPLLTHEFGTKAPDAKDLAVNPSDVYYEMQRLKGVLDVPQLPPPHEWPLHLKTTTPLDLDAVRRLPIARESTRTFFESIQQFFLPERFAGYRTSRTVRKCALPMSDIARATEMGKVEPCRVEDHIEGKRLPEGVHAVNAFAVHEMKGRRRLITEPGLNACLEKPEIPHVDYPSRLARRQALRDAKYMIQIDFEAYYDAIPIPASLRNNFVFRARDGEYFRLCTLPTGARWSVAVGQAVTWMIVDIPTNVKIMTMIDNILVAAADGQESEFISAVRTIIDRIRVANLLTSPDRETLAAMNDGELLEMATQPNTFLGEEFFVEWTRTSGA